MFFRFGPIPQRPKTWKNGFLRKMFLLKKKEKPKMIESVAIKKQQEKERIFIRNSAHQFERIIQNGTH